MTKVMYDSVTVSAIPADAEIVAVYVAGDPYPNKGEVKKHCPNAKLVEIALHSSIDADCLDMEPGGALLDQFPAWCRKQAQRGVKRPIGYTSLSNAQALVEIAHKAGLKYGDDWRLWTAHYSYREHRCDSSCGLGFQEQAHGTQWTNRALGRNLDQSLVGTNFAVVR